MAGRIVSAFTIMLKKDFASKGIAVRPYPGLPRRSRNVILVEAGGPRKATILYVKESTNRPAFWGLTLNQIDRIQASGHRWFGVLLLDPHSGYMLTGNQILARTASGDFTLSGDGDFKVNEDADLSAGQRFTHFADFIARSF